jgi:hypothetical protein
VCTAALWHHVPMPPSQSRSGSEGALSSVAAKTAGSRVVFITSSLDRFDDRTGAPAPSCVLWCLVVESVTRRQRARSRRQHKYCRTTTSLSSRRVRCERAIRTVPRHLLKGLQVGFPCCLAFPFKNAPRMNRGGSSRFRTRLARTNGRRHSVVISQWARPGAQG